MLKRYFLILTACVLCCLSVNADRPTGPVRAATWPSTIDCSSNTVYKISKKQFFSDKVSVLETTCTDQGYLFNLFSSLIPTSWLYTEPKQTLRHCDPVDALSLGVLIPDPAIVEKALSIMNFTKAFEKDGDVAYGKNGKIEALPYVELLCTSLEGKINRGRLAKAIIMPRTLCEYNIASWLPALAKQVVKQTLPKDSSGHILTPDRTAELAKLASAYLYLTIGATIIKTVIAHRDEHTAIDDGINCLEQIVKSEQLAINGGDKAIIRALITKLENKIQWSVWGYTLRGTQYGERLDELAQNDRLAD